MSVEGRARGASHPARVVFFGSGAFGVPILEEVRAVPGTELAAVVTLPDRPSGRRAIPTPTPVGAAADAAGLEVLRLASVRATGSIARIGALRPDVGVLADFGRIVPPALLAVPPRGILNVHPSLLPRHRGATPIAATILAGDEIAGVTVMLMDEGLDTGPVLATESWALRGDETAPALEAHAAGVGGRLIRRVLPEWLRGEVQPLAQADAEASLTRPFRREDGRLDPAQPATRLERMVRALRPWPGTFLETEAGRLVVLEAALGAAVPGDEPGLIAEDGDGLALATVDGRLRLLRVQPAGGRPMAAADFRRGSGRWLAGMRIATRETV